MSDAGTHEPGSAAGQHGAPYALQCMEIWGGNRAADTRVELTGLDAWVYARPYQGADEGGDIHYLSSCASGDISRLLVADVSGHGAGVAGAASALRTLMRRNINHVEPRRLAAELNSAFGPIAREGGFATAVVASYYRPKRRLSLCNAGHPRPMLFRRAGGGWSVLDAHADDRGARAGDAGALANIPLGIADGVRYDTASVQLEHGDVVLVYTDSLIEARGPVDDQARAGGVLGERGLLDVLASIKVESVAGLLRDIAERVPGLADSRGDDVTMLAFSPNGRAPEPGLRGAAKHIWRYLKGLRGEPA